MRKKKDKLVDSRPTKKEREFLIFQVLGDNRIAMHVLLVDFSCSNSEVKVRDPRKGNEIIHHVTSFDARGIHGKQSLISDQPSNHNKNLSSGGNLLILEYLAPRRECRVNIKITAWSEGIP